MTAAFFSHPVNLVLIRLDVPPAMRLTIPCASMKIPTPDAKIASIYRTKLIHADAFVCVMCFFIFDFCTPSREDCALVSSRPCSSSLPPTRLMFACARNKKKIANHHRKLQNQFFQQRTATSRPGRPRNR